MPLDPGAVKGGPPARVRLLAIDLDGTLLNSRGELSGRTTAALAAAQAAGLVVVLVTGRPVRMVLPLAQSLGLHGHVLCSNGAATHRLPGGEAEDRMGLSRDLLQSTLPRLRESLPGVAFALEYGDVVVRERGLRDDPESVPDILTTLREPPPVKLIVRAPGLDPHALNARIQALFGGLLEASSSGANFSEVAAAGVNKGYALARLCGLLKLNGTHCLVFGDAHNDLPMFSYAGRSVAMGNAVPEVKEAATRITLSNDEDGVAVTIEALLAGELDLG